MKPQNLLAKIAGSLTLSIGLLWLVNPARAQIKQFYYFPSSFFNPVANFYQSEDNPNVIEILAMHDDFEIVTFLLRNTSDIASLEQEKVTFLAPTDKAFQALPSKIRAKLSQPENLNKLLMYHTITREIQEQDIKSRHIDTLLGSSVAITGFPVGNKYGVKLNDATASDPLPASNGVIVPIDRVLIPPEF